MYYGKNYEITKNFLGTQMLLKEDGKVVLKAGRIVELAPDVSENIKEDNHIFITSNEPGVYDVYHAEQKRYLLKSAHFTADNFCDEQGIPIVFTKGAANYYVAPDGVVHDLRLDMRDVYFSQDGKGIPNHEVVFRLVAGLPEVLYREEGYNPAHSYGDDDYRTSMMLSRLPQGDHVDNAFLPLLLDNQEDLSSFTWILQHCEDAEQSLRRFADQYVRLTEGKFFDQAEYLHHVARHFKSLATSNGYYTVKKLEKTIAANKKEDEAYEKSCEPKRQEMERLNQQINAINKALGQPEYDFDPDYEFFGQTAPYEVVPADLASMPQEVQDAYAERAVLMKKHQDIYYDLDVPEVDHSMENYKLQGRLSNIAFAEKIEALAEQIEQEQKVLSGKKQTPQPAQPVQSTEVQSTTVTPQNPSQSDDPTEV